MPEKIHFTASESSGAVAALEKLRAQYGDAGDDASVIVALGGDGFILQTLHLFLGRDVPIYGMNFGSIGFLMNEYREEGLPERLASATPAQIHPLLMRAEVHGEWTEALAFNDVSLLRETRQTAKLRISVDGKVRLNELICDGILIATPAGSTAYNLSAHGPILPIESALLAMTPLSAFRPRRWRGALLPHRAKIHIDILEPAKRPVSATADSFEVRNVTRVDIAEDRSTSMTMLFDADRSLEERILAEQFLY
ncbi:MAG: NAD kinase [Alphaproteobacteria bacterium]|nr:NAD kinase [Alphaproteobacteria bacterium]